MGHNYETGGTTLTYEESEAIESDIRKYKKVDVKDRK